MELKCLELSITTKRPLLAIFQSTQQYVYTNFFVSYSELRQPRIVSCLRLVQSMDLIVLGLYAMSMNQILSILFTILIDKQSTEKIIPSQYQRPAGDIVWRQLVQEAEIIPERGRNRSSVSDMTNN